MAATPVQGLRSIPFASGHPLAPSPYAPRSRQLLRESEAGPQSSFDQASEPDPIELDPFDDTGSLVRSRNAGEFCKEVEDGLRSAWLGIIDGANREEMPKEITLVLQDFAQKGRGFLKASATHKVMRRKLRDVIDGLETECFTWSLIDAVEHVTVGEGLVESRFVGEDESINTEHRPGVEKVIRLLRWLEKARKESLEELGTVEVKPLDDPAYRAAYAQKRLGRPLNTDKDVGELEDVEIKAEERLSRAVWELVRCGQHVEAQDLCCEAGQPWRAVVVGGGAAITEMSRDGIRGGARRTWREVAKIVATSKSGNLTDKYERACYGVLCGEVELVLPACSNFEDCLWVRLSALLDSTLENDTDISDGEILVAWRQSEAWLSDSRNETIAFRKRIRTIQSLLSLGSTLDEGHMSVLCEELLTLSSCAHTNGVEWIARLSASLVVYVELCGSAQNENCMAAYSRTLCTYVSMLIKNQNTKQNTAFSAGTVPPAAPLVYELVAQYCSYVPDRELVAQRCAGLLIGALKADMREQSMMHTTAASLNSFGVGAICDTRRLNCLKILGKTLMHRGKEFLVFLVTKTVDVVWSRMVDGHDNEPDTALDDGGMSSVEVVVRSLEFLMFPEYPAYDLAIKRVLQLTRKYFLEDERDVVRDIVRWIPGGVVDEVRQSGRVNAQDVDCWRCYIDACEKFAVWKDYVSQNRPVALPARIREQAEHDTRPEVQAAAMVKLDAYVREMEAFAAIAKGCRDSALEALSHLLHFNDGWMKWDSEQDLRKVVVPEIIMMLQHVYGESGMYKESVDLAIIVSDPVECEEGNFYKEFTAQELKSFLQSVGHHAILLADQELQKSKTPPYVGKFYEAVRVTQ